MKRESWKYIVLGIGLGFLIAAGLLLKFGGREKAALTDREIIDRARALGMIFLTEVGSVNHSPDSEKSQEVMLKPESVPSSQLSPETEPNGDAASNPKDESKTEEKKNDLSKDSKGSSFPQNPVESKPEVGSSSQDADVITEVISGDDPNVPSLLPPKDPNRPKTDDVFESNHF
ncbi:hypothetical protein EII17_05540 [Clostridiales bacterium COT073_COT-073]|nr:hypothetical protein EII17_05540 [Clostridiales bacterium COT073_COT-073]